MVSVLVRFSQLMEPESINISTVGIRKLPLLRRYHTHMLGTTVMHYPTCFQGKRIKILSAFVPGLQQVTR